MFEDVAIQYINLSEMQLRLISYAAACIGGIIGAFTNNDESRLLRVPYFVFSSILFFVMTAEQIVWLNSSAAWQDGYLWVFAAADIIVAVAVGYFWAGLAMSRSRDAYGHARYAFFAFVPIANLVLMFTPSKEQTSEPVIPLLKGTLGVFVGIVVFMASNGLAAYINMEASRMASESTSDANVEQMSIDDLLRYQGLEATLQQLADAVPQQKVDEITILQKVEADGSTLRYLYEISSDLQELGVLMRSQTIQHNCTFDAMRPILEAGGKIEHVYYRISGTEIGIITVTKEICTQ